MYHSGFIWWLIALYSDVGGSFDFTRGIRSRILRQPRYAGTLFAGNMVFTLHCVGNLTHDFLDDLDLIKRQKLSLLQYL